MAHLCKRPRFKRPVHHSRDSWVFYFEPVPSSQQIRVLCSALEFEKWCNRHRPIIISEKAIHVRHMGTGVKFIFSGHDALFHWMVTEKKCDPFVLKRRSFVRGYDSPLQTAIFDSTYAGRIVVEKPALGMHDVVDPGWDDVNWEILPQQAVWTDMNSNVLHFGDESFEDKGELLKSRSQPDGSSSIPYHLLVTESGWFLMLRHVIWDDITGFERVREIKMHCNFNDDVIFREIIEMQSKDFEKRYLIEKGDQVDVEMLARVDVEMLVLFHEVKKLDIRGKYIGENRERMVRNVSFTPTDMSVKSVFELDLPDDKIEFLLANLGDQIELIERNTETRIQIIPFFHHSHGWNAAAVPPRVAHVYGSEPNVARAKSRLTKLLLRNRVVNESNSLVGPSTLPSLDLKPQDTSQDGYTSVEKRAEELHKELHTPSGRSPATTFTWRIRNVSNGITKKHFSSTFDVGSFKWKIMITPNEDSTDHLSMYLNLSRSGYFRDRLIYARFTLSVVNHSDRSCTIRKVAKHHFSIYDMSSWGFPSVIPFAVLFDPMKGYCKDGSCTFEAEVAVHSVMNYCSDGLKKGTDYVCQNVQKRMEAVVENLHTITIKVACEKDFYLQNGKDIYFDLVDYDEVPPLLFGNEEPFINVKEKVCQKFGVSVERQRFWIWAHRENHAHRAYRSLTSSEEAESVGQLRNFICAKGVVRLFLEDLSSMVSLTDGMNILLFLKLYDPREGNPSYLGKYYVRRDDKVSTLKEKVGFARNDEFELYEEICCEHNVCTRHIDKKESFGPAYLQHGDIVWLQKCIPGGSVDKCRYPNVTSFLNYQKERSSKKVRFRSLEKPEEDEFSLELPSLQNYTDLVKDVAARVGFDVDPSKIRLARYNCFSHLPDSRPIKYKAIHHLSSILVQGDWETDILYYEVLDIPLLEWQGLKTLKVCFYDVTKDEVVIHTIRLKKQSCVGDVISELKTKVELSDPNSDLILVQRSYDKKKIYKIFQNDDEIENIDDQYRRLQTLERHLLDQYTRLGDCNSALEFEKMCNRDRPILISDNAIHIRHVGSGIKFIFGGHDALFHWMVTEKNCDPFVLKRRSFVRSYESSLQMTIYDSTYAGRIVVEKLGLGMHDVEPEWDDVN